MDTFTIEPKGPFSLHEAALFGFGQRYDSAFDGTMRLAFCVDGYRAQAGVSLTQSVDGTVHGTISPVSADAKKQAPTADSDAVVAQVARVLSLDHDATGYQALGDDDPVIGRLLDAAPGLRPPLFYSPYEAALWAVISMRRPRPSAERWRSRLAAAAGAGFGVAGTTMWAVPTPERIVEMGRAGVAAAAGVEPARAERVVAVAQAAQAGSLDAATLSALGEDEARATLRSVPGIGPFYADLILIRAAGVTDVLPLKEPRLLGLVGELYGRGAPVSPKQAERLAEAWRPWRTWVAVLFRAAGPRLVGSPTDQARRSTT
ncbi:MAG: DNA-3-methyladenine glycosylase 2 family protein [Actinomycetota bacterium]|nr:DNA-3-methyladenine glycosylase 2 family protein [Actinomycetota bacterium]